MQKKIIALAIAGLVSGGAFAQSTVTIYGIVDQALDFGNAGNGNKARLISSGYMTERIGFRVEEDLGGGLKAFGVLEAGLGSDVGAMGAVAVNGAGTTAQVFNRESKIGLRGSFGEVSMGRLYAPWFNAVAMSDAWLVAGAGSSYSLQRNQTTRINNALRYDSPNMSGFTAAVLYGLGDTGVGSGNVAQTLNESVGGQDATAGVLNKNVGRHVGLNLRYANGPMALAFGYGVTDSAVELVGTNTIKLKQNTLSGSYDFGVAKLFGNWSSNKNDATPMTVDNRTWSLAVTAPVGKGVVKFQLGQVDDKLAANTDSKLTAIGYHMPLSKRTTVYTTYAKVSNSNNAARTYLGGNAIVGNGATTAAGNANHGPSTLQAGVSHQF